MEGCRSVTKDIPSHQRNGGPRRTQAAADASGDPPYGNSLCCPEGRMSCGYSHSCTSISSHEYITQVGFSQRIAAAGWKLEWVSLTNTSGGSVECDSNASGTSDYNAATVPKSAVATTQSTAVEDPERSDGLSVREGIQNGSFTSTVDSGIRH